MNELIIRKSTHPDAIKGYFEGILKLSQTNENFPADIDHVWPLVYSRKEEAVRVLKENFFKNEDYIVFRTNAENPKGGRPAQKYKLSTACLEYFIARKVRPVFEVYRKVFHKAVQKLPDFTNPAIAARAWADEVEQKQQLQVQLHEQAPKVQLATAIEASPRSIKIFESIR